MMGPCSPFPLNSPGRTAAVQLGLLACFGTFSACEPTSNGFATNVQVPWSNVTDVELALTTDLKIPQEIDSLKVEVVDADVPGYPHWQKDYELGASGLTLPATVTLPGVAGSHVRYRVLVWKGVTAVLFAEAIVTTPAAAALIVAQRLERVCSGFAATSASGEVTSTCPDKQACRAGACASIDRTQEQFPLLEIDAGQ